MSFAFRTTDLSGVLIIESPVFSDARGFFMETYVSSEFAREGLALPFVQENHSHSVRGTLRGMHAQRPPKAQGKLIRVVAGEIFDVAADVRRESPTYRRWVGVALSASNKRSLYIPPGYMHGFCVLSADAEVIYKTTEEYAPESEYGARWDDPLLSIDWPIRSPLLSDRDQRWPWLSDRSE